MVIYDAKQIDMLIVKIAEHHGKKTTRTVNQRFDPTQQTEFEMKIFMDYGLLIPENGENPDPELVNVNITCDEITRINVNGSVCFSILIVDSIKNDKKFTLINRINDTNLSEKEAVYFLCRLINEGHWDGIQYQKELEQEDDPMGCLADYE